MAVLFLEIIEVESCKVVNALYCIWFDKEYFHIEDLEARKILMLLDTQLRWFLKKILEFLRAPENVFFFFLEMVFMSLKVQSHWCVGWVMRCVGWKKNKEQSFIHICPGVSRQGWKSFHKMLESFLMKHDYLNWYRKHLQTF